MFMNKDTEYTACPLSLSLSLYIYIYINNVVYYIIK